MAQAVKLYNGTLSSSTTASTTVYTCPTSTIAKVYYLDDATGTCEASSGLIYLQNTAGNITASLQIAGTSALSGNGTEISNSTGYQKFAREVTGFSSTTSSTMDAMARVFAGEDQIGPNKVSKHTSSSLNTTVSYLGVNAYSVIGAGDTVVANISVNSGSTNYAATVNWHIMVIEEAAS